MRATPDPPATLDIQPEHWALVQRILRRWVPQHPVWAFGSRVNGTATRYSDLDLAIITDQGLGLDVYERLTEAFAESDLPFKVDVVDWATTNPAFRALIARDKVVALTGSGAVR